MKTCDKTQWFRATWVERSNCQTAEKSMGIHDLMVAVYMRKTAAIRILKQLLMDSISGNLG
jgi:hypothetical protein